MKSPAILLLVLSVSTTFALENAEARSFRSLELPNGERFDCATCHVNMTGGARNAFGQDVQNLGLSGVGALNTQATVWSVLCPLDSDGDGYTNGVELGDPNCTWEAEGDPVLAGFNPTRPGDPTSTPCGNGTIEAEEMCDGANLNDTTCVDLGLPDGGLSCNANCTFNTVNCVAAPVNNQNPPNNQNPTNNEPGTNNQTGGTNNVNPGNNTPGNNSNPDNPNPTNPNNPLAPDSTGGDLEPFFCDGEMAVEDKRSSGASVVFVLIALLGIRRAFFGQR